MFWTREYSGKWDDKKMTIVLDSTPATADDAAEILGVPKTRVKWLKELVRSRHASSAKIQGRKFAKNGARAVAAKGRKKVRGKAKKRTH